MRNHEKDMLYWKMYAHKRIELVKWRYDNERKIAMRQQNEQKDAGT